MEQLKEQTLAQLFAMKSCCIDPAMTGKVTSMVSDPSRPEDLWKKHSLLSALLMWSYDKRLCNMNMERLLALFRCAWSCISGYG